MSSSSEVSLTLWQEIKQSITMSLPLIVALLAQMGMDIVDTVMMGRLGPEALAAGLLSSSTYIFFIMAILGLFNATAISIARCYGAHHTAGVRRVMQQSFFLVLLFVPLCIVYFKLIPSMLLWMGQDSQLVSLAKRYLDALIWGVPAWITFISLREFTAAIGYPRLVMIVSLIGIPVNATLNYAFIYGIWGVPKLGIAGIGYATAIVEWLMVFALISYLFAKPALRRYLLWRDWPRFHKKQMRHIFHLGWPISAMMLFEVGLFALSGLLMGYFGTIAAAAHQIAIKVVSVAFMFPLGVAQATALLVGRATGARNVQAARRSAYIGLGIGLVLGIVSALLFLLFPQEIIYLFLDVKKPGNQDVMQLAVQFLFVAAVFQVLDCMQTIATGALRGYHDTFVPMALGMLSFWAVGLGSGYVLAFHVMENGGLGLWWGLALGIGVSGFLLYLRLEGKIRNESKSALKPSV